jgi:uncharacterized protein YecE (DUF72 family)
MAARIKTGTTTWAERGLVASGWYPPHVRTAEAKLHYYASQFPLVENDAGYWAVLARAQVETWARRTPDDFTMNMKAHALLTGHYTDPKHLPKDLRDSLSRDLIDKPHVYARELDPALVREVARRFRDALVPLHAAGKLGAVLFQFPVWFPISRENKAELTRLRDEFSPYRIAVEFRNHTWMSERNVLETLEFLGGADIVYTCVDEPQGFVSSVPPIAAVTSDLALVRMHGRNAARWQRGAPTAAARFAYLYSTEELRAWVPRVHALAERAREVHVLMNNCHADYAVRNAREMAELLERARPGPEQRPPPLA